MRCALAPRPSLRSRSSPRSDPARRGGGDLLRPVAPLTHTNPFLPCPDDWGWANFAPHRANFTHGNDEFPTPNLAALAAEGMLLDRFYGHKFCGPSRAAIQTGRNPIHVNVLDSNLDAYNLKDPQGGFMGVPRNMTGIAAKLTGAGYQTHMVGKVRRPRARRANASARAHALPAPPVALRARDARPHPARPRVQDVAQLHGREFSAPAHRVSQPRP